MEDQGDTEFHEERRSVCGDGESLTLLTLKSVEPGEKRKNKEMRMNFYDMGGHMQYYCAQQIFKNRSSIYLLTFERYSINNY